MVTQAQRQLLLPLITAIAGFATAVQLHTTTYYEPTETRTDNTGELEGPRWLARCMNDDELLFNDTRLRRDVWNSLLTELVTRGLLHDSRRHNGYSSAEKLLIFTHLYSHGCSFRSLRARTGRSLETISRAVNEVLEAVLELYPDIVKPPPTGEIPTEIREDPRRFPWFADAIGAVDGTHIPAYVLEKDIVRYRDHKGRLNQNVLAVVDFKMNFTYLLAGWEGSAHDA